jgi:hypothetical protein
VRQILFGSPEEPTALHNSSNNKRKGTKAQAAGQRNSRFFSDNFNVQPLRQPTPAAAPLLTPVAGPPVSRVPNVKRNKKGRRDPTAGAASSVTYYNKKTHSLAYGSVPPPQSSGSYKGQLQQPPGKILAGRPNPGPRFPAPTYNGFKPIQPKLELNFKPLEDEYKQGHETEETNPEFDGVQDSYIVQASKDVGNSLDLVEFPVIPDPSLNAQPPGNQEEASPNVAVEPTQTFLATGLHPESETDGTTVGPDTSGALSERLSLPETSFPV